MKTVEIKISRAYLREYILFQNRNNSSATHFFGSLIYPFIEKRPKNIQYTGEKSVIFIDIELKGKKGVDINGVVYVNNRNQQYIERCLKNHFNDILFFYLQNKLAFTKTIKKNICDFCKEFGISLSDETIEMLKKRYYRQKKRVQYGLSILDKKNNQKKCPYLKM